MGFQNIGPDYWKGETGRLALIAGKEKFTDPQYIAVFKELASWAPYMGNGFQAQTYPDSQNLFSLGKAAIYPAGSWDISTFRAQAKFPMGAFPPPLPAGDTQCYISDHTDIAMGVNSASKNKEDAKKFLEWLTTPEFADALRQRAARLLPAQQDAGEDRRPARGDHGRLAQGLQVDDPQLLPDPVARHAEPGERAVERVGPGHQRHADARSRRQAAAGRPRQVVQARQVTALNPAPSALPAGGVPHAKSRLTATSRSGEARGFPRTTARAKMAEPPSQVVASMPRGRFLALMALFLGPAVAVYTLFSIYPLLATMGLSTYTADTSGADHFIGLANFVTLLSDSTWSKPFWNAAKNNLIFFAVHMAVQNPIGIALAGLLSLPGLKLKGLYRTVIFLPTMLSVVIVGFSWNLILSPLWGVAEGALKAVGLGSWFAPWLGLPSTALVTLALISVWQFVGIPLMLIYAALLNIPDELVDAARVDGLGQFRIFLHIKLPLVLPTIGLVSILTFVGNFNAFDLIYSVKGALAGPNFASDILGTFFYRTFFGNQLQLGNPTMGAAVATVMFFIILVGVCLYLFIVQRRMRRYAF